MRHATAAEAAGSDALRPLSEQGRQEARQAAEALRQRDSRPSIILTSPRLRAKETAEIVATVLGVPMEVREGLNCGATAAAYLDALRPDDGRDVLVVAHNPEISAFATLFSVSIVQAPTPCASPMKAQRGGGLEEVTPPFAARSAR